MSLVTTQQRTQEQEDSAIREGMAKFYQLRDERDALLAENASLTAVNSKLVIENEFLRDKNEKLDHSAAFFMRHSTELVTNLRNIDNIVDTAMAKAGPFISEGLSLPEVKRILIDASQRAKDAAYRPSGAPPAKVDNTENEPGPAPAFMADHNRQARLEEERQ